MSGGLPPPAGASSWSATDREGWARGTAVWERYEGRPLADFRDMRVPLRVAQLISRMEAQLRRLVAQRAAFEAGRVAGNIRRHKAHLDWLRDDPSRQISEADLQGGA